jgi:uncharacterized cupin superfamily protein
VFREHESRIDPTVDTPGMRKVNIAEPEFEHDPDEPPAFRAGMFRFGPLLEAKQMGASVYELPPGKAVCPYHYEYAEEEWLVVLSGHPSVRHPEGTDELGPWDAVLFPTGPAGAHQIRNDSDEPARVLMFSTVMHPAATVYPDSDKIAVWTGNKDDDVMVRRSSAVDYFDGEG